MDNKVNTEDNSNPKNGNATVRDSLVISETTLSKQKKPKKRSRDLSSDKSDNEDDESSDSSRHRHKRSKKSKKKKIKRKKAKKLKKSKYNSDSSSDSDNYKEEKRKKKEKKRLKKSSYDKHDELVSLKTSDANIAEDDSSSFGPAVPDDLLKSKAMVPMTKEEWEKQQSHIRRVYDSETGRHRLIRGDGEIIEECVSRDRHRQINKQATAADGLFFQMNVAKK